MLKNYFVPPKSCRTQHPDHFKSLQVSSVCPRVLYHQHDSLEESAEQKTILPVGENNLIRLN